MASCEHYRALIAGLLDNELTTEESVALNEHLIRCASCRADYEELRQTEKKLDAISYVEITDEAARSLWKLPYARTLRNASLLMVFGGYAALLVYGFITFLTDGDEDLFGKVTLAAIVIGFLVLLGSLVVERISTWRVDPYKEIER
jgi:predicted anti-sigma-YlaC factor YlaD